MLGPLKLYLAQCMIASTATTGTPTGCRTLARFPHPQLGATNLIGTVGGVFFFAALCFNFVILLGNIVREKEESMFLSGTVQW